MGTTVFLKERMNMNNYDCYHTSGTWLMSFQAETNNAAKAYALAYFTKPVKTVNEKTGRVVLEA